MSLRMIEMVVAAKEVTDWEGPSKELKSVSMWREPLDDDLVLLRVLAHSEKTEAIIKELDSQFHDSPMFRMVIFEVQATLPPSELEEDEEGNANGKDGNGKDKDEDKDPQRIACVELVQQLSDNAIANRIYIVTVILSTVVAAIGLIQNSVAVVIGAMVIAPLLGPNLTLSLATTLGDIKLARKALWVNLLGVSVALAISMIIGLLTSIDPTIGQISSRTHVELTDIVLALAAGSAGALALTTGLSAPVVGVMVAVALLPPLVTTGLLIGAGKFFDAYRSGLLTVTNIICINLAGVVTFVFQGLNPRHWWEEDRARKMVRKAAASWITLLVLLVVLILLSRK